MQLLRKSIVLLMLLFPSFVNAKTYYLKCDSGLPLTINTTTQQLNYNWKKPSSYILRDEVAYVFSPTRMTHKEGLYVGVWAYDFKKSTMYVFAASSSYETNKHSFPEVERCFQSLD